MIHITKNTKGFTLVEIIVVLVIMGIIAAITIPNIAKYIDISNQNARNKVAHSLFNVSQSAIKSKYNKKVLYKQPNNGIVDINNITPKLTQEEIDKNTGNIVYLKIDKDQNNKEDTELYKLIHRRLADQNLLNQAILIEYNKVTGNVLNVFYSDELSSFGYTNDEGYNLLSREKSKLKKNKIGYYGVSTTGFEDEEEIPEENLNVILYDRGDKGDGIDNPANLDGITNYGVLECEIQMPENINHSREYILSVLINGTSVKEYSFTYSDILDMPSNIDGGVDDRGSDELNGFYKNYEDGKYKVYFVLDTQMDSRDIVDFESQVGDYDPKNSNPTVSINVSGLKTNANEIVSSEIKNAFYSGGNPYNDGDIEVSNMRHIKYIEQLIPEGREDFNGDIEQTKNIFCRSYKKEYLYWPELQLNRYSTYNGNGYRLYDITTDDKRKKSGVFCEINNGATAKEMYVDNTDEYWQNDTRYFFIQGKDFAGGIAGVNSGTIKNCQVNTIIDKAKDSGGIAGFNKEGQLISECYSAASVYGDDSAGGVVGFNEGSVEKCEVGTFGRSEDNHLEFVGIPYYGISKNKKDYSLNDNLNKNAVKNNVCEIVATGNKGAAGGIVGECNATIGHNGIVNCVNAASVTAKDGEAGGLVGYMTSKKVKDWGHFYTYYPSYLRYSYNAGKVYGEKKAKVGGLVGHLDHNGGQDDDPIVEVCYNTAIVESNEKYKTKGKDKNYAGNVIGSLNGDCRYTYGFGMTIYKNSVYFRFVGYDDEDYGVYDNYYMYNPYYYPSLQTDGNDYYPLDSNEMKIVNIPGFSNSNYSSVGIFDYPYPRINADHASDLGNNFHRTPWNDGGTV